MKEAKKDMNEAENDLRIAKNDSVADFQKFKTESLEKISDNRKKIAELKTKSGEQKKEVQAKYDQKVAALEEKNNKLQMKIDAADKTKTSMWSSFKREFNHDFDEFGRSFRDLGTNNVK